MFNYYMYVHLYLIKYSLKRTCSLCFIHCNPFFQINSFQTLIITDGSFSFCSFRYSILEWSGNESDGLDDPGAQVR